MRTHCQDCKVRLKPEANRGSRKRCLACARKNDYFRSQKTDFSEHRFTHRSYAEMILFGNCDEWHGWKHYTTKVKQRLEELGI